jgi:ABC-type transporter Mla MlaB component
MRERKLYDNGTLQIHRTADPLGLAMCGQIDELGYQGLVSAIEEITRKAAGEIHVDLTHVTYCDLAGLWAIIRMTQSSPTSCRRVVLHRLPLRLETVLRVIGWSATPGLILADGSARSRSRPGNPTGAS